MPPAVRISSRVVCSRGGNCDIDLDLEALSDWKLLTELVGDVAADAILQNCGEDFGLTH